MSSVDQVKLLKFFRKNKGNFYTVKEIKKKTKRKNVITLYRKLNSLNKSKKIMKIKVKNQLTIYGIPKR